MGRGCVVWRRAQISIVGCCDGCWGSASRESESYLHVADRFGGTEGGCESTPFGLARGCDTVSVPAGWDASARGCPARAFAVNGPVSDWALKNSVETSRECRGDCAGAVAPWGRRGQAEVVATN